MSVKVKVNLKLTIMCIVTLMVLLLSSGNLTSKAYTDSLVSDQNDVLEEQTIETRPIFEVYEPTPEDLAEEAKYGDMEMIAQLVMAEAGNQDLTGKRLVVSVVLNRVDSPQFPNSVEEVIFQDNQFSVIKNGMFDVAGWNVTEECYQAVLMEYENRSNYDILYFSGGKSKYAKNHFKHQDHWFGW